MLDLAQIQAAAERVKPFVKETPVFTSTILDKQRGMSLFFKGEHLQRTGSFKVRGAFNMALTLKQRSGLNGIATHSSGNHAQAVALVAQTLGVPAYIVMPHNAPSSKIAAVQHYGAQLRFCEPTIAARIAALDEWLKEVDAEVIPPYNDPLVIEGQATLFYEWHKQCPEIEAFVYPIGGGGVISGAIEARDALQLSTPIFGAEPEAADDAFRSLERGERVIEHNPKTIADGLRTTLGEHTFPILQRGVQAIELVSEEEIAEGMKDIYSYLKQAIEPSAAVAYAAAIRRSELRGKKVGVLLCGGNADLSDLPF